MISTHIRAFMKSAGILFVLLTAALAVSAKGGGEEPVPSAMQHPVVITLVVIMCVLLLAIVLLAFVMLGAMDIYRDKMNAERAQQAPKTIIAALLMLFFVFPAMAQENAAEAVPKVTVMLEGVSNTAFYFMVSIIALEMLILLAMLYSLRILMGFDKQKKAVAALVKVRSTRVADLWRKINSFKPAEQEADLMMDHSYDGIHELDNRLPPWWLYGFYLCIVIAVVYMWRFHVSHSGSSSLEEYNYAIQVAEEQKLAYLKNAASNVDENTVVYLNDEASLEAGKNVFVTTCGACHGKAGEGGVGPNLTDDYWLHGGSIKDVFKTIKYGWPEKGMRSWKDDYSPRQLAQIASYVKSLKSTNPANAKEKQGEFYKEEIVLPDSTNLTKAVTKQ